MSLKSRQEYLTKMRQRYSSAKVRVEKSLIIDELVHVLDYNRKYAIQVLNESLLQTIKPITRKKPLKYQQTLPVIQLVWEALDYPCAERLHPVLLSTAELLENHNEVSFTPQIREELSQLSRATLARRLSQWYSPKSRRTLPPKRSNSKICAEIPIDRYAWDETRPGALEIDLVEHNGGSSQGHYVYTLSVVDVVSGYSRRRAVLGRGQTGIHRELSEIIRGWPFSPWGIHSDNGSEFLSDQLLRFTKSHSLAFTRSRPYKKNDNAHVEQKNRQYVREIVGYERYDSPEQVDWLNQVYECLDLYSNLFLPMRKLVFKEREGSHVKKRYDTARTPLQRLIESGILDNQIIAKSNMQIHSLNPLALHRKLETLLLLGSQSNSKSRQNANLG